MSDKNKKHFCDAVRQWDGKIDFTYGHMPLAVQMEMLQELRKLNRILSCPNFLNIPRKLDAIRRNTTKKRRVRK